MTTATNGSRPTESGESHRSRPDLAQIDTSHLRIKSRPDNPLQPALGLARLLHDRTRDFNAGVRNQVIELLALELSDAEHVVNDLLVGLVPDVEELAAGVGQIELREVIDAAAQDLATAKHMRISVSGDASVRADPESASHIVLNLLRCIAYLGGESIEVKIGSGFSKVFVEMSFAGAPLTTLDSAGALADDPAIPATDKDDLAFRLSISVARRLARALGGDVTGIESNGEGGSLELSLPKTLGQYRSKKVLAASIFDPTPTGPTQAQIAEILDAGGPGMVFQPIVELKSLVEGPATVVGHEALARFPRATPPEWLEAAGHAGRRLDLELAAIRAAVREFNASGEAGFLSMNLSDATLLSAELPPALAEVDTGLVVLELSEVALIKSYELTGNAINALRDRGVRLAIDNVGAGEIDLWSILRLQPELIKIDMSLVRGAETSPNNRALIKGLAAIAKDLGIVTVAEGIETVSERDLLVGAGVDFGQGYLIGTPHRLEHEQARVSRTSS